MIFNFWRPFPFIPPKEGRYLCCLDNGMVIDLYFRYDGKWRIIDNYTICWIVEMFKVAAPPKWTDYRPPPNPFL